LITARLTDVAGEDDAGRADRTITGLPEESLFSVADCSGLAHFVHMLLSFRILQPAQYVRCNAHNWNKDQQK